MSAVENDILVLDERKPKTGGAVDHIAAAAAVPIIGLGIAQIVTPLLAAPFTGIEDGTGGQIIGLQWAVFGAILAFGGLFRMRVLTIFAAEFLLIAGIVVVAVNAMTGPEFMPLLVNGAVAGVGLVCSGLARLTDKAELKRELRIAREHAKLASEKIKIQPETHGAHNA